MFIPLTYLCILAVGMIFIPLDAANYKKKIGEGGNIQRVEFHASV